MPKIIEDKQIFDAVMAVVVERGYSGATTIRMAEVADVSEVTLFRKYGTKLELVKQAMASIVEEADFGQVIRYSGNPQDDLLKVVEVFQGSATKHGQFFIVLFGEIMRHPDLFDSIDAPFRLYLEIAKLIERYQNEDVLDKEHPMHATASLMGPLVYTTILRNAVGEEVLPYMDLAEHVKRFIAGRQITK